MRLLIPVLMVAFLFSGCRSGEEVFMFSYFTGNGETGLHLAWSEDGLTWQALNNGEPVLAPTAGKDRLMRDPCIIKGPDGRFHMVWTTGWTDRYIGYASSEDLLDWSEQITIPVMMHEPEARNSWAPEIFYDEANREYLIFWATTIPGRHSPIETSPREDHYNHRMYYTTTSDFETFSETRMFFNPDFSVIDCTIFEKNGRFYMFLKNENPVPPEKNIRLTVSENAAGPYPTDVSDPITGNYWAEGPTALQVGDSVYVYFDRYMEGRYGAVRSADMENWDEVSGMVSFPAGARHGTAFTVERRVLERLKESLDHNHTMN
jgi:beta-xylosidase